MWVIYTFNIKLYKSKAFYIAAVFELESMVRLPENRDAKFSTTFISESNNDESNNTFLYLFNYKF